MSELTDLAARLRTWAPSWDANRPNGVQRHADLLAAADMAERVERVKALHVPNRYGRCVCCGDTSPCPTVAALTGEDDQ